MYCLSASQRPHDRRRLAYAGLLAVLALRDVTGPWEKVIIFWEVGEQTSRRMGECRHAESTVFLMDPQVEDSVDGCEYLSVRAGIMDDARRAVNKTLNIPASY